MLNFLQNLRDDSLKESLKRTMINQEIIFKKQVHELHRLYDIQKSLTKGNDVILGPFAKDIRCEILQKKRIFQENLTQTPLDLRLSPSEVCDGKPDQSCRIFTDNLLIRNPSCGTAESLMNDNEWAPLNQGSNKYHGVKRVISIDLDLNKDQPDESSFQSNEIFSPYPSSRSSSCSPKVKPIEKQPKSQNYTKDIETNPCAIDLESMAEPSSDLTEEKDTKFSVLSKKVNRTEKSTEAYMVQKAAMSLICISLQRSLTNNQDSITKSSSNFIENEEEKKKKKKRRKLSSSSSSMDSYELLVLTLEESSVEEDCVTSKAFEINEFEKKNENGITLRRGRRLKDFQKDVLPTLSTLSRHEIWEDVKIMQGVIRSREYKRLQKSKMGNSENWVTPVRNRRSEVNRMGRRRYS